jgi:murein DD-endopeptidase MepM/ murein hydrolase activator NlpD
MTPVAFSGQSGVYARIRHFFRARDMFFHDGNTMSRFTLTTRMQVTAAAALGLALTSGVAGIAGVAASAPGVSTAISTYAARTGDVDQMASRVAQLQAEVAAVKLDARAHAKRLEARQAFLANLLTGEGDADSVVAMIPAHSGNALASSDIHSWFSPVEQRQKQIAGKAQNLADARYRKVASLVSSLGLDPQRLSGAMGGPYEPVAPAAPGSASSGGDTGPAKADPQFKALFNSWKRLDQLQQGVVSIPSVKPVTSVTLTSGFGVRSDPFRGGRAMHAGVDIPGPIGTAIYATADGIVGRAGWVSGYGKLIELEHGRGIQTRYGHLSNWAVTAGSRVKRGQLVGYMGSTGRSTGSHLHYEVRIDGRAVNPIPFLRSTDYLLAMQAKTQAAATAMGGPTKSE